MQPTSLCLIYEFKKKNNKKQCAPPYLDSFAQQNGGNIKISSCNMLQCQEIHDKA